MRYKVLTSILLFCVFITTCGSIGISSKLDFGESSPKLIGTASQYRGVSTSYRHFPSKDTKPSGDFEGIGVVCVSGGCNKTNSDQSKDSIQTEVVVQVKTSVDVNKNKSTAIDDTPDVPIIVGTAGTNVQDSQARSFNQRPLIVSTDFGDAFSSVRSSVTPSLTPSFSPLYSPTSYNTPTLKSDNVYVHQPNLQADIKIKTLPPVTLTMKDDGQNRIELQVPYFEPSYPNHYFGESPPPQVVWYPKRPGLSHPVEYKPKSTYKQPSFWSPGTPHKHVPGTGNTCSCKNQPALGLQWYPNLRKYDDPGSQINDKLAPLN